MKRFAIAALAAATFAAPLALPAEAAAQHRGDRGRDRDRDRDRDWDRDRDRRDRDWRDDRRHYRDGYRDGRRNQRAWDRHRHNGYEYRGRWYYGPPPAAHRDYAYYGFRAWRRGDRLPHYYRDHYRAVDWRYHRLRPPPRGYHYVRDDRGDYLLVGIMTGVILGVILAN
jgi:Ni/Co efflux regulator RcnB